jgi:voltage-gated potassium channel
VTITTVGYGDITPARLEGKIIGGVMMVLGMFTLALFAGIVGSTLLGAVLKLRREQFRMSNRSNHVVLCGFDPESRLLHDVVLKEFRDQRTELVLFAIGDRPASVPPEFTWIDGDPTKESELDKARIQDAAAVIIAGSRRVRPQQADAQTILIVFTIRSWMRKHDYAKNRVRPLYIIAEILETENVEHARTAGANEVIETPRLGLSLMAHSVSERGTGEIMTSVALSGAHNLYIGKNPFDASMSYHDLVRAITERHDVTVLGLQDASKIELSPEGTTPVGPDRGVIYLAPDAVLDPYHLSEDQ